MNINKAIQLALKHHQAGNLHQAEYIYREILKVQPDNVVAYCNLGSALQEKGQLDEAITCYQKALKLNPDIADVHCNLGNALREKGQFDEAITCYQKALKLNPDLADVHCNLGNALQEKGQLDEAITCYQKALKINPNFDLAYNNLGGALREKGQLDEAITCCQKALKLNPNLVYAYCNLGGALREKGQLDEAITCCQKALKINPNFDLAYNNLGSALREKGQLDEAITCYQKALKLNPNLADAHGNMSLALLLTGNFKEGWKEYEWRWKTEEFISNLCDFSQPLWDGSDITGKTILLHDEQGFGDAIQFIRYVPLVIKRGAKIIIECQKELISLLQNVEGIHQIIAQDEHLPLFDIHCPLMSLPLVFGTTIDTIPAEIPYIKVNTLLVQKWKDKVKDDDSEFKVGLSWAGRSEHKNDRNRSFPLDTFTPLAQFDNIVFYSLQKGKGSEQVKSPPDGMKFIDYTDEIQDFLDTAALIENLDLIISADTAVAHLSGALGKPVWTLIPFAPDWRWMLNRDDSPWYPTMRLFRQPSPGDWKSVIERVKEELTTSVMSKTKMAHRGSWE